MKKILPLTFTILASTYGATASADNHWYLGALYNAQEISMQGRDFNTAGIIAGYTFNEYFAIETRLATGTSGYSSFYGTQESKVEDYSEDIDSQTSIFIKASYPFFESFNVYGLAGYTKTKIEVNGLGQSIDPNGNISESYPVNYTKSESGFSYGVGLNYQLNEQFNIFVDYQILPDFEPFPNISKSWQSTTVGVNYYF